MSNNRETSVMGSIGKFISNYFEYFFFVLATFILGDPHSISFSEILLNAHALKFAMVVFAIPCNASLVKKA